MQKKCTASLTGSASSKQAAVDFADSGERGPGSSCCSAVPWACAIGGPATRCAGQRCDIDLVSD